MLIERQKGFKRGKSMNPQKGKGDRYIYCTEDSECLNLVMKLNYSAFNCEKCEIYLKSETFMENKKTNKDQETDKVQNPPDGFEKKNQLVTLNDALFGQLKRLTDTTLDDDKLGKEIARSKAVSNLAAQIVQNAKLALEGAKAIKSKEVDREYLMLGSGD